MKIKFHARRLTDGRIYVQGVIPADAARIEEATGAVFPDDAIGVADLVIVVMEDRTAEYVGMSNEAIRRAGMP